MLRKHYLPALVGLFIITITVFLHSFLLDRLSSPYMFSLGETLLKIEMRDRMRKELGVSVMPFERERLVQEKFGPLPDKNQIHLEMGIMGGWKKFCVFAYALMALGALGDYLVRRDQKGVGPLVTHIAALPAFAFALPEIFFPEPALRIIKPLCIVTAIVFIGLAAFFTIRKNAAGKE